MDHHPKRLMLPEEIIPRLLTGMQTVLRHPLAYQELAKQKRPRCRCSQKHDEEGNRVQDRSQLACAHDSDQGHEEAHVYRTIGNRFEDRLAEIAPRTGGDDLVPDL